jgi:hypothetical protein
MAAGNGALDVLMQVGTGTFTGTGPIPSLW